MPARLPTALLLYSLFAEMLCDCRHTGSGGGAAVLGVLAESHAARHAVAEITIKRGKRCMEAVEIENRNGAHANYTLMCCSGQKLFHFAA
jgi:hypothetical protein